MGQNETSGFTKPIGPIARLIGFRWVERASDHAVLRLPRWVPRAIFAAALDKLEADYRIRYGSDARITYGRRLVRFDWSADA